jgi:DNA-binding CsgD family transcriptional regulator
MPPSILRSHSAAMNVLEAAHLEAKDVNEWAGRVAAAGDLLFDLPLLTLSVVERRLDHYAELVRAGSGVAGYDRVEDVPVPVMDCLFRLAQVARPIDLVQHMPAPFQAHWQEFTTSIGMLGGGGIMGYVGRICFALFGFMPEQNVLSAKERLLMSQVAAHVEAGLGLCLGEGKEVAVLRPDGRIEHARGEARALDSRERLASHVRTVESARTRAGRRAPAALDTWTALVNGRFGLVERVDSDGQRFYLILEESPRASPLRALSAREAQILELSARGVSGKNVAYSLGISPAAVSQALGSAALKIGCRGRTELVNAAALLLGPKRPIPGGARFTPAELEVLALVRGGFSNAEIAARRETSDRTVSNQVASLLRKAHVPSRRALAALPASRR